MKNSNTDLMGIPEEEKKEPIHLRNCKKIQAHEPSVQEKLIRT